MGIRVPIQPSAAAAAVLREHGITLPRPLLRAGVRAVLREAALREAEVSITLFADAEIARMNAEYLHHEGATDVISFALWEPGEDPVGDVYVGVEQALRQARTRRIDPAEELLRLAVHGALHVLGHEHPEGGDRVNSELWQRQERIVAEVLA